MEERVVHMCVQSVVSDLCDPMDCNLLSLSVHEIFQATALEWDVISSSKEEIVVCI